MIFSSSIDAVAGLTCYGQMIASCFDLFTFSKVSKSLLTLNVKANILFQSLHKIPSLICS